MFDILAITTPIYIIVLIGYIFTRVKIFSKADLRVLGKTVINLALPALLFQSLSQNKISEILNPGYLLAYTTGSLLVIGLGYITCRSVFTQNYTKGAFYVMGMSCSNSGYIGYPVLLLTIAPVAGITLAMNMVVENIVIIPILLFMVERGRDAPMQRRLTFTQTLKRLITNPLLMGLTAGLLASLFELKLPLPMLRSVNMLAAISSALSLLVIGGSLFDLPTKGLASTVTPIVFGKLIIHPSMMILCFSILPIIGIHSVNSDLRIAAVLMAAMPMMGIYTTLAQPHGYEDFTAVAMLITTITSFFSVSILLLLVKKFSFL